MPAEINPSQEKERIVEFIRTQIAKYEFEGAVIGISGGIDSAVVGKLLTEALGRERVFALILPERDSSKRTVSDSLLVCRYLGIRYSVKSISPLVRRLGIYRTKPQLLYFQGKFKRTMLEPNGKRPALLISTILKAQADNPTEEIWHTIEPKTD